MKVSLPSFESVAQYEIQEFRNFGMNLDYSLFYIQEPESSAVMKTIVQSVDGMNGFAAKFDRERVYLLWVDPSLKDVMKERVILHEMSHILDYIFDEIGAASVDTEIRAYALDHLYSLVR